MYYIPKEALEFVFDIVKVSRKVQNLYLYEISVARIVSTTGVIKFPIMLYYVEHGKLCAFHTGDTLIKIYILVV